MGLFMGIHCTSTGEFPGLGEYIVACREANRPVSLQSVGSTRGIYDAQVDGFHEKDGLVFRQERVGGENLEDLPVDPDTGCYGGVDVKQFAAHRYNRTVHYWPPELDPVRVYTVMMNEPSKELCDIEFIADVTLEQAKLSIRDGRRYLAYGWSAGTPEKEFWEHPKTLEYLRLCEQYPKLLGVSLHEYSLKTSVLNYEYPWHIGRFQALYDVCEANDIAKPYIHVGEGGWSYDEANVNDEEASEQFTWLKEEVYKENNISWCTWTMGQWSGSIVQDVAKIMGVITDFAVNSVIHDDVPSTPEPKVKIVIWKMPQESTKELWMAYSDKGYESLRTFTASIDDMLAMLLQEQANEESHAVIVNPNEPSQVEAIAELEKHNLNWIEG